METHKELKPSVAYRRAFLTGFGLFFLGLALDFVLWPTVPQAPSWPYNVFIGIATVLVVLVIHLLWRSTALVRWLAGIPVAITSVSFYTLLVLIMGFMPQDMHEMPHWAHGLAFTHLAKSWTMLFILVWMMLALGLVTLRRMVPFRGRNIGFFLNHAGLWLTLGAATLGTGDFYRLTMQLEVGGPFTPMAFDSQDKPLHLPFAAALNHFSIDEYPPKLAIYNYKLNRFAQRDTTHDWPFIEEGKTITLKGYQFSFENYLPFATRKKQGTGFEASDAQGATHAIFVRTKGATPKDTLSDWLADGNFVVSPHPIKLNDSLIAMMLTPEVKAYRSIISWKKKQQVTDSVELMVNKPITIGDWRLYQVGYAKEMGRWSDVSILEAVTDPWLPVVYIGVFMMLAGAVYLFWQGRKFSPKSENN